MVAPSYTTDLIDIDLCEAGGKTWAEPTATGWTLGAAPSSDDDNPFQGILSMSKAFNAVGVGGMMVNNGGGITLPTDGAILGWFYWASPGSLEPDADGGIRIMAGSSLANFLSWDVGGKTTYVYGGWINYAVNTTITPDDTVGSGLGNSQYVGAAVNNFNSIFKGNPFLCDAFRYGRCEARMNGGDLGNGYATFAGYAEVNDAIDNRWGLIQEIIGGYLVKGLVIFGYGSVVDFRDANKALVIQNTNKVTANFNGFEVRQATSRVDLTSITITALGTTSRGRWITTDNADVNIESCIFTDIGTFDFASNSTILNSTFRRCALITQNGATFDGCCFDGSLDAEKQLMADDLDLISNCKFISPGSGHAIRIDTPGTYTFSGNTFSGFGANQTTDACIYNNSGGLVEILLGSSQQPTVRNGSGSSTTFPTSVTLTMTVKNEAGNPVIGACAFIDDPLCKFPFIMNTITNENGIATTGYSGEAVPGSIWRVRKYGYKNFKQVVDIGGVDISLPVTLILDPQQT